MQNPFLSNGTQVVTRIATSEYNGTDLIPPGSVGKVINGAPHDNEQPYLVEFSDNRQGFYFRTQLEIRSHFQRIPGPETPDTATDLYAYVIYRCVVGSRGYGLDQDGSDTDIRGIYLPPASLHWSLEGVPEQLEHEPTQEVYWELQKFLSLALKANPNVLECLYTPLIEKADPLAQELLAIRHIFVSKLVYQTYTGYAISQFKKMDQDFRVHGQVRWKHAMHLIRLLLSVIITLKEGVIPVRIEAERAELLAIRNGQVSWEALIARRKDLERQAEDAFVASRLPDRPDYDQANQFLIKARRAALELS